MSKGKTFGCLKCGKPFTFYPPDDLHSTASLNKEDLVNTVEMKHKCECGNIHILYWGSAPIDRDRSIEEEIKKELMRARSVDDGMYSGDDGMYSGDDGMYSGDDGMYSGDDGMYSGDDGMYSGRVGRLNCHTRTLERTVRTTVSA